MADRDRRTIPFVALSKSASRTWAGVALGSDCRYRAATPVVCGAAMEVPVSVAVAVSLVFQVEVMPTPGANQSTQSPKLAQNG